MRVALPRKEQDSYHFFCGLACRLFFSYAPPLENSGLFAKAIFTTDLWQDGRQFAPCAPAAVQVLPHIMRQASYLLKGSINSSGCRVPNGHNPRDRLGRDTSSWLVSQVMRL